MKRTDLLGKLKQVSPALADTDMLPIMTCIWFEQDTVTAYNDRIGITVDFDSEFSGAVHGDTLIKLLDFSHQDEVDLVIHDGNLIIASGKAKKITLAAHSVDRRLFKMPAAGKNPLKVNLKEFAEALQTCQRSVSDATTSPEYRGVTLVPNGDLVHLFTVNGATMTNVLIKIDGLDRPVVLPHKFCSQFGNFAVDGAHFEINTEERYALVVGSQGSLYGKLIEVDKPLPLIKTLNDLAGDDKLKLMIAVPAGMVNMLNCASTVIDDVNTDKTQIAVVNGTMTLTSKGIKGENIDHAKIDKGHPDITVRVNPKLLKIGLDDGLEFILLGKKAAVMTDDKVTSLYVISVSEVVPPKTKGTRVDDDDEIPF